ncbi:hypothetical protein DFH06DRAFT_1151619 [Mycena polygramma]|nr:hypothetical protein DFH06DRAFT_1151619 [Mycena polygramma]
MHRRGIEPPLNPSVYYTTDAYSLHLADFCGIILQGMLRSPAQSRNSVSGFPLAEFLETPATNNQMVRIQYSRGRDIYNGFLYPPERQSVVNVYVPLPSDRDERKREPEPHRRLLNKSEEDELPKFIHGTQPHGHVPSVSIPEQYKAAGEGRLWHKLRVAGARSGTVAWIMECAPLDPFALLPGLLSDVTVDGRCEINRPGLGAI